MKFLTVLGLALIIKYAESACSGPFNQCGGKGYTGITCCQSGYTCQKLNEWYSQCVPSTDGGNNKKTTTRAKTTKAKSTKAKSTRAKSTKTKTVKTTKKTTAKKTTTTTRTGGGSGGGKANPSEQWPRAQKTVVLKEPLVIKAGQTFDGLAVNGVWTSYGRGVTGQGDCRKIEGGSKDVVFRLETGATLKNVIIGKDSIEHVHCIGDSCTVENVWWDDVCEDALSLKGSTNPNAKFYLRGGGARDGSDKIVQHNSAGTVYISNFQCLNSGKLYRSCGNCKSGYQGKRNVVIENVNAKSVGVLVGINSNYGDTATFKNVNANGGNVCYTFTGNNNGKEPTKTGSQCKGSSNCVCK